MKSLRAKDVGFQERASTDEQLIADAERVFRRLGEGRYVLEVPTFQIALEIDRVRWDRDELKGLLDVRCLMAGARTLDARGLISTGNINLTAAQTKRTLGQNLKERSNLQCDWTGLLEDLAQRVRDAESEGDPPVAFAGMDEPATEPVYHVDGFPILANQMTILFGMGGSAKSFLALYFGLLLARQGVHVLYADWEVEAGDHWRRLKALGGALPPTFWYLRCARPLVAETNRLSRVVASHAIDYLICDSIGYAADGPPEEANTALGYARAVRTLGIGSLHLSHVTKGEQGDKMPFGSGYWHNSARSTWFIQRSEESLPGRTTLGLFHRKHNLGPLHRPLGFDLIAEEDRVIIDRSDVSSSSDLAGRLGVAERVRSALQAGPKTLAALSEELEVKQATIQKTVKRGMGELFELYLSAGGVRQIRLKP